MTEIYDNIKGQYRLLQPEPELAPYVEYFWETAEEAVAGKGFTIERFASWAPTFSINLGNAFTFYTGSTRLENERGVGLLNMRSARERFHYGPGCRSFGAKLYPASLPLFFETDRTPCRHSLVSATEFLPGNLLAALKRTTSFPERAEMMGDFLRQALRRRPPCRELEGIRNVIAGYEAAEPGLKVGEVAARAFLTPKTLGRRFASFVGANPKELFASINNRRALNAFLAPGGSFDPLAFGYYDWSHFSRAVLVFTGQRPAR